MMRHGHGHGHRHGCGCNLCRMVSPIAAAEPIVCPPQYRFHDQFIPQEQPVIHPIVNVNREHIVPFPRHFVTETTVDVMGGTATPAMPIGGFGPGFGPEFGEFGPGFGPEFGEFGPGFGHGGGGFGRGF